MTYYSQNGWPVLQPSSKKLHNWVIPTRTGDVTVRLRHGSVGFLLCHEALWQADDIDTITGLIRDDWGHSVRPVRGSIDVYSNHASGTAIDLDATEHPLGVRGTFTVEQERAIKTRLGKVYGGLIVWGAVWQRPDEMHFEIRGNMAETETLARKLLTTPRGRRLIEANPTQKKVVLR